MFPSDKTTFPVGPETGPKNNYTPPALKALLISGVPFKCLSLRYLTVDYGPPGAQLALGPYLEQIRSRYLPNFRVLRVQGYALHGRDRAPLLRQSRVRHTLLLHTYEWKGMRIPLHTLVVHRVVSPVCHLRGRLFLMREVPL